MITEEVIKEIYKNYNKPCKNTEELNLPYFAELLKHHRLNIEDKDEVLVESLDEMNPFKRFLKRGIYAVLEFDRNVAFVFESHILFFNKKDDKMSVNFRPVEDSEKKRMNWLNRIFCRNDDEDEDAI